MKTGTTIVVILALGFIAIFSYNVLKSHVAIRRLYREKGISEATSAQQLREQGILI